MIVDLEAEEIRGLDADLCIIGGGAAGIALAREFDGKPVRVCLLEGGGPEYEARSQALYEGRNLGIPYYALDTSRLRLLGGTTAHWGGACWPLRPIDFKQRDWIPGSGWPITLNDLLPYYEPAQAAVGLGPFDYETEHWAMEKSPPIRFKDDRFVTTFYQNSWPPTRFGHRYKAQLERSGNITTILHANVRKLLIGDDPERIEQVEASTLDGRRLAVRAKVFVVAAGGIETPRLLLLSNDRRAAGIGNQHDLVGRYFMEHLMVHKSMMLISKVLPLTLYKRRSVRDTQIRAGLTLAEEAQERERVLDSWFGMDLFGKPKVREVKGMTTPKKGTAPYQTTFIRRLSRFLEHTGGAAPLPRDKFHYQTVTLTLVSEQAPNPASRVRLGEERDRLGQRRVELDWRLTELDYRSALHTHELLARELGANDFGRLRIDMEDDPMIWTDPKRAGEAGGLYGSFHHMGTTRMHDSPRKGVVDRNCRVHGTGNLYIAGSSVFPTCGYANPTLTLLALTYRLADHLGKRLAAPLA